MASRTPGTRSHVSRSATALRWAIALLPILALVLATGLGAQRWRAHQSDKAAVYRSAEAALAAGDYETAELSFGALGGFRDAEDRLNDVQAVANPVRQALDEAVATLDSGNVAGAILQLEAIVAQAPEFAPASDLLATSRAERIEQLQQQAVVAEANRDWLSAELAIRELSQLQPGDGDISEQLDQIVRLHAPFAFVRAGAVYIAGPDGEAVRALTPAVGAMFPSWSPDRTQIAFFATTDDEDPLRGTLMVMQGDGSDLREVAVDVLPYFWPVWSPDGRGIAFTSVRAFDTDTFAGSISLNVYEIETGIERDLTGDQLDHAAMPTWSPDGTQIAFVSNTIQRRPEGGIELQDGDVYAVPANGGPVRNLTQSRILDESWVQWSPSGKRLLILTAPGDWSMPAKSRLYLLEVPSDALSEIVIDEWQTSLPFWSPDGARIAFVTGGDTVNIWSDQGLQWVQLGSDVSSFVSWSPDGRSLLVPSIDSSQPSFVVDVEERVGALTTFELEFDDLRSGSGPPLWGGITPPTDSTR